MASVTWVIVLLSVTNRRNDSETHQEDISKYRNQQVEWPQNDPGEAEIKSKLPQWPLDVYCNSLAIA